ncbi:MAG: hypothetical protein ACRERV_15075, partial [Methylococcales bacterium]
DEALIGAIAQALIKLITDDKNMILAKQCAAKAVARFSMDKLADFYLEVMAGKTGKNNLSPDPANTAEKNLKYSYKQ